MKNRWLPRDEPVNQAFRKSDYLYGLLVLFISFFVYLLTLTPTVGFHDSGELITVAWTLGIAHPPGYPLYTIFGKLFCTIIPIGNIAYRMNAESALFASLTVMMVYFIILQLSARQIPAICASLILAFSLTFWEQATIAEKYTLNALFFSILIFILLRWQSSLSKKHLYLFSFLLGLSFCHHFQTVYIVPASVFFILAVSWQNRKRKPISMLTITKMILLFILPLTLWSYLPLRASQDPVLNWGDPSSLDNFIIHITGKAYGGYFSPIKESFHHIIPHSGFFFSQFKHILWIGLLGLPILFLRRKILFLFFILIFAVNTAHSIRYTILNICDYYISSFILFAILIGFALSSAIRLKHLYRTKSASLLLLLLPLIPYCTHHFQNNRTKFYFAYDYGRNILRPIEKGSIIFTYGDSDSFSLWCLQYVEERQPDVAIIVRMLLSWSWYIKHIAKKWPKISFPFDQDTLMKYRNLPGIRDERFDKIVVSNIAKFPVYVGPGTEEYVQNFLSFPKGALFKLLPTSIEKEKEKIAQELEKNKLEFIVRGTGRNIFKDREALKTLYNYSAICNIKGDFYRQYQIDIEKAISEYKKALELDPCNLHSRLNLAFAYLEKGELDGAKCEFERVIEENKNFNPSFVHYGLGLVYQNKGMIEQARREYKIALNIDPTNTYAKQMLKKCKNFR